MTKLSKVHYELVVWNQYTYYFEECWQSVHQSEDIKDILDKIKELKKFHGGELPKLHLYKIAKITTELTDI